MVVIIMGVAGAGKTVVGQSLARRLGGTFEDADDWHSAANIEKMRCGIPLTDDDRVPWIRALSGAIRNWMAERKNVVLACSALRKWQRAALREGIDAVAIRFVYLRGTYETIDRRLRLRAGHFMPESLLRSQFETLQEPDPSEALVIDTDQPVATIVECIVASLEQRSS
jgi:gluconokinase